MHQNKENKRKSKDNKASGREQKHIERTIIQQAAKDTGPKNSYKKQPQ